MFKINQFVFTFLMSLFFGFTSLSGQVKFLKTEQEIPAVTRTSERYVDFILINNSNEEIGLLRAQSDGDVSTKFSTPLIKPGGQGIVRVQINPIKKGNYKRRVAVYLSSYQESIMLSISGKVEEVPEELDLACPDFKNSTPQKVEVNNIQLEAFDVATNQTIPLSKMEIKEVETGKNAISFSNSNGIHNPRINIGRYNINVTAKGYSSIMTERYFSGAGGNIRIGLIKLKKELDSNKAIAKKDIEKDTTKKSSEKIASVLDQFGKRIRQASKDVYYAVNDSNNIVKKEPEKAQNKEAKAVQEIGNPNELSRSIYKPNHILFLIDVSSSMGEPDKLPLLKKSMIKLISAMRDIDKITIITYADRTDILSDAVSGDKKESLIRKIESLEAIGSTQGKKAIDLAYKKLDENFLNGGNNQIYLATDGDFKLGKSDDEMYDFLKSKSKEQRFLSVVGFGRRERSLDKMKKVARNGGGSFIHITLKSNFEEQIMEEVKNQSVR